MKRLLRVPTLLYLFAAFIFAIAFVAILVVVNNITKPVDPSLESKVEFAIAKGESVKNIAVRLHDAGLVRSPYGFRLSVKREGLDGKIQAGIYDLSPAMSTPQIAMALTKGMNKDTKVTFPEGYRLEQIAETLESNLGIPTSEFMTAAAGKEGFLFPDTYFFAPDSSAQQVVGILNSTYVTKTGSLKPSSDDIILASLVERETKGDAEKPVVAGILQKRLSAGWPLQLDATIQYIAGRKGEWWPNTTLLDRKRPSAYNTYLNRGLPPSPICNPGLESIKAVLSPVESEYWYYLHAPDGTIHYAVTSAEHESNIDKYIR